MRKGKIRISCSDRFGCFGIVLSASKWDEVDCARCASGKKKRATTQDMHTYKQTCAACLRPENVGYLFFFYAVCAQFVIHSLASFPYFIEPRLSVCVFLSCNRAARSYSLFLLIWHSLLSLTVCFAVFVCASLSLDCHHTVYTLRLHVGFIVLVRPVLWIFVWERLTCMLCDRLSISWKHESNEYGNAAIFFRRQIFWNMCVFRFDSFFWLPSKKQQQSKSIVK